MLKDEVSTVEKLTGASLESITFSDKGSYSRCYLVDGGSFAFKFKKRSNVNYENEAKILHLLKNEELGIKIQTVGWDGELSHYIGLYGINGRPINEISLNKTEEELVADKIAKFLTKIRSLSFSNLPSCSLPDEIKIWHERFLRSLPILSQYFKEREIEIIKEYVLSTAPKKLQKLGEKLVFSHGDLWENNIFLNQNEVGIIDFSDGGYYDEGAEFMYLESDALCEKILDKIDADEVLREKVKIRRAIKMLFIVSAYREKPENEYLKYIKKISAWLKS